MLVFICQGLSKLVHRRAGVAVQQPVELKQKILRQAPTPLLQAINSAMPYGERRCAPALHPLRALTYYTPTVCVFVCSQSKCTTTLVVIVLLIMTALLTIIPNP